MPQTRPKNVSTAEGYTAYLDEQLDVLLYPKEFVDFVRELLHKNNRFYWTYLENATCIEPEKRVLIEVELCYATRTADIERQQDELCAQIARDEEEATLYLSALRSKESDYENMLPNEAAMQIYEFFGPEYNDGLFYAETTAELDKILNTQPQYEKQRSTGNKRRSNKAYCKRRLRQKASNAKKTFIRRLDEDLCPTGNCAGFIVDQPSFATLKATRIWKRAKKNGYVAGDIYPADPKWRKKLIKHRKYYYINLKK